MSDEVSAEILTTHVLDLAKNGHRLDGRAPDEMRTVKIVPGYIKSADGSALVELGGTKVVCGVKLEVGKPYPDTPLAGVLSTNAELPPLCSPDFEPGPPTPTGIELSRVVDRAIRAAEAVDLKALCITPSEKCWNCFVDVHVVDHLGNAIDAAMIAGVAALHNAVLPNKKFEVGTEDRPLGIAHFPTEVTFVRLGDTIVVDPTTEEEAAGQGRLTVATDELQNICAMQKGRVGAFSPKDVVELARRAQAHGDRIRSQIRGG